MEVTEVEHAPGHCSIRLIVAVNSHWPMGAELSTSHSPHDTADATPPISSREVEAWKGLCEF